MAPYITETTTEPTITENSNPQESKTTKGKQRSTFSELKRVLGEGLDKFSSSYGMPLIWVNIISIVLFHFLALYAFIVFPYLKSWRTLFWGFLCGGIGGFGVTAGVHRYWCHKSYKANVPLRVILMLCFQMAGQNTIFDWVRDHRVHHKFSETDADPHNATRGFFFSHVGWLMQRKHPEVLKKGRMMDMSDVEADPVVQFSQKHFTTLKMIMCFILPTLIPVYGWGEDWYPAICVTIARYVVALNFTWLVNSAAHMYGAKPYDKRISPVENLAVSMAAMGEGWHNYHHTFPWDYKAAELGNYHVNITTMWLDFFNKIGWAWDMKEPSEDLVKRVISKTGDGTHYRYGHVECKEDGTFDMSVIEKDY